MTDPVSAHISFLHSGEPLTGHGRAALLTLIEAAKTELLAAYARISELEGHLLSLTQAAAKKHDELTNENRAMRAEIDRLGHALHAALHGGPIVLKGWTCTACQAFNGEGRELRTECRACGKAKGAL